MFHHGRYIIDPFLWVLGSRVVELFAYAGPALREIEHENLTHAAYAVRPTAPPGPSTPRCSTTSSVDITPSGRFEILGRDAFDAGRRRVLQPEQPGRQLLGGRHVVRVRRRGGGRRAGRTRRRRRPTLPERASEEFQSRLFLESIANDSDPLVPIEVPMHHVEIVRALYKSAHELRSGEPAARRRMTRF